MKKLLIIDGNNHLYRAHFSHSSMAYKGKSVSCIYGFISILSSMIKKLNPDGVCIVWDGKKSKNRLRWLPTYKAHRKLNLKMDPEDVFRQKDVIIKMVKALGIYQYHCIDLEGDDLTYAITQRSLKKGLRVIIASADKDFHQVLSNKVTIWDDKNNRSIHKGNCKKQMGYTPEQCVDYLSLGGDTSDNIPGVRGFGEKTLAEFFETYQSVQDWLESGKPFKRFKPDDKEILETLKRNKKLINLRWYWRMYVEGEELNLTPIQKKTPKVNQAKFESYCLKYGINTFRKPGFITTFKNQWQRSRKK